MNNFQIKLFSESFHTLELSWIHRSHQLVYTFFSNPNYLKYPADNIRQGQEIFLFPKISRKILGPSHPPIQWVLSYIPDINLLAPEFYI
jgi:hypothetical protein